MQTYPSILIHPSVAGGRCSGELRLAQHGVFFSSPEMEYSISYAQMDISAGGSGNRFVFFKDKHQSDISIYTGDKSVLKHPELQNYHGLRPAVSRSRWATRRILIASASVIAAAVLLVVGLYLLKDVMVEKTAQAVPVKWEQEMGDKLFSTLSLNYKFVRNDSLKAEFMKVAKPLFTEIEKQGFIIDVYFVSDPTINAFALPGGKVVIQTGLIQNAQSWEEVLGVLSHEIAHVTRRHHIRSVLNSVGIYALVSFALGDVSAILATVGSAGGNLAQLANSRAFEYEADETGWDYLVKTKINPSGMISFFETLDSQPKSQIDSTMSETIDLSFLSTHPDTKDRIGKLKSKLSELDIQFTVQPANFEAFKKDLTTINLKQE